METRLEQLEIAVDSERLAGTLLTPAMAIPAVLFVHGWGGSQAQDLERARAAAGLGCACLTFDLRGHVRYEQQREMVTREQNLADLLAAYDMLAVQRGVDPSAIAVVGNSYGGYLASILTSMRGVRWLALHAPALYMDGEWDQPKRKLHADGALSAYRQREVRPDENRALGACAAFKGDVLVVESEHDAIVPHQVIANYVGAFVGAHSLTSRVIKGADHALSSKEYQAAYSTLLTAWITEMVTGARAQKGRSE